MAKEGISKSLRMDLGMMAVPETVTAAGKGRKDSSGWLWTWLGMGQTDLTMVCFVSTMHQKERGGRVSVSIPS